MASFVEFLGTFNTEAAKRGEQFEYFVKWFLKNDPEWSTQVDQIWLWEEYPKNWGRDCGIDLVFRHKNGENWAVQAKCYAPTTSITKADVDSFISESNRDGIDKLLLIATTDLIGANAKQVCDAQDKKVTRYLLSHFDESNIEYPASLEDLYKAKSRPKPEPREHQVEAIEAVATKLKDTDRGQMIMACGTGKTFTTLWIKEKLGVESTLVLIPSLGLLSQTLHEWTMAANKPFEVLCVCSDMSVGKKGADDAVHSVHDLAFPVTSNADEIKAFLNRSGSKVIFSTYQSSPIIAEVQRDLLVPSFDLAIADEAHRCAGKASVDFSTILDAQKIRARKRLFTTATPRTYSSNVKKAAEDRGIEVEGMDDEAVFGKTLFALSFGESIKRGLLTDYRVVIIGVDDPTISAWIEKRELLKADFGIEMDAESLASQVGLLKAIKDYDLHRIISFHSRVNRAEEFSKNIHKVIGWIDERHKPSGELKTDFVSGEMPTDKRRKKLAQLKCLQENQRGLLTNARCLSEGVDVPSLDGVAFIDPRSSQIDIIQAVGRAIRLSINKQAGTIVLPVFIGQSDDPEQALKEGNFKPIWDVLNALKAHDDVLSNELNQLRTNLGRRGGGIVGSDAFSKITLDLPLNIDASFVDGLRTLLVENVTASWDFYFGLLMKFVQENGHSSPAKTFVDINGFALGSWVANQRVNKVKLSLERIKKLESLLNWAWNSTEKKWLDAFELLKEHSIKTKTCTVDRRLKWPNNFRLESWVIAQRMKHSELTRAKKELLESLDGWSWDPFEEKWNYGFSQLESHVTKTGSAVFPANTKTAEGYRLGGWVTVQRVNKDSLTKEQQIKLEGLKNWSWDPIEDQWETAFNGLKNYAELNGNCAVPRSLKLSNGVQLGVWKANLVKRKELLDQEKIARLEALPGWTWDPHNDMWNAGFSELTAYIATNKTSHVPYSYKSNTGFKLGSWVYNQKTRKEVFSKERITRLEELPDWQWVIKSEV